MCYSGYSLSLKSQPKEGKGGESTSPALLGLLAQAEAVSECRREAPGSKGLGRRVNQPWATRATRSDRVAASSSYSLGRNGCESTCRGLLGLLEIDRVAPSSNFVTDAQLRIN